MNMLLILFWSVIIVMIALYILVLKHKKAGLLDLYPILFIITAYIGAGYSRDAYSAYLAVTLLLVCIIIMLVSRFLPSDKHSYYVTSLSAAYFLIFYSGIILFHKYIINNDVYFSLFAQYMVIPAEYSGIVISLLVQPTMGSYIIAVLLSVLTANLLFNRKEMNKSDMAVFIISILAGLAVIITALSRGPVMMLIVTAGIMMLYRFSQNGGIISMKMIYSAVVTAVIAFIILFIVLQDDDIGNVKMASVGLRQKQISAAIETLKTSSLITGIGLFNFKNLYTCEKIPYIHNQYLSILLETGIPGLIIFLGYFFHYALTLFIRLKRDFSPLRITVFGIIIGLFFTGMVDSILYSIPIAVLIWILSGWEQGSYVKTPVYKDSGGIKPE